MRNASDTEWRTGDAPQAAEPTRGAAEAVIVPQPCAGALGLAVIYDRNSPPPRITITQVSQMIQTIHADGIAVAVMACAQSAGMNADDVPLIQRL
ncbi:hypothetical protein So717_34150 [Roseobacter cerasinus]|uniref:Uncharacterized protein n=1 Tax=Roseobacter cerasinus TaxID=2602289 RepID=A0A640VVH7_9RHOB|nr:hypothetical protein [Roseobacter cerasinus]GFE51662.1 hypothetical protein So717_34150 [Roseobacter cerasinus]